MLFMVEAATGITDYDAEIADVLRRSKKPVILCVNKVDTGEKVFDTYQFYSLGLGELYSISAANGSGTGDLLDAVVAALPEEKENDSNDPYAGLPRTRRLPRPVTRTNPSWGSPGSSSSMAATARAVRRISSRSRGSSSRSRVR